MSNNRYWLSKLWKIHNIGQKAVIKNHSGCGGGSREGVVIIRVTQHQGSHGVAVVRIQTYTGDKSELQLCKLVPVGDTGQVVQGSVYDILQLYVTLESS